MEVVCLLLLLLLLADVESGGSNSKVDANSKKVCKNRKSSPRLAAQCKRECPPSSWLCNKVLKITDEDDFEGLLVLVVLVVMPGVVLVVMSSANGRRRRPSIKGCRASNRPNRNKVVKALNKSWGGVSSDNKS